MNTLKKSTLIIFSLTFMLTAFIDSSEKTQKTLIEKIDHEINCEKLNKTKAKFLKQIKKAVSEKSEEKLIEEMSNCNLTETQKAALLEALETVRIETSQIPE